MNHDFGPGLSNSNLDVRRRAALGAIAVLCVVLAALTILPPKAGAPEIVAQGFPPNRAIQVQTWTVQDQASLDAEYLMQSWPDFGSTMTATIAWPQQQAPQDADPVAALNYKR